MNPYLRLRRCCSRNWTLVAVIGCIEVIGVGAWAKEAGVARIALPDDLRLSLQTQVNEAKGLDPGAFADLLRVKASLPTRESLSRGGGVVDWRPVRDLGSRAFWPIVDELVLAPEKSVGLPESLEAGWRIGLLHALGYLRDRRAEPVLRAIVEASEEPKMIVAAAAAISRNCDDSNLDFLLERAEPGMRNHHAVLQGMAYCHRYRAALRVSEQLLQEEDQIKRIELVEALGGIGTSSVWEMPRIAESGEGEATRETAASTLIDALVHFRDPLTTRFITEALLVIDWDGTSSALQDRADQVELDLKGDVLKVKQRFEDSTLRRFD